MAFVLCQFAGEVYICESVSVGEGEAAPTHLLRCPEHTATSLGALTRIQAGHGDPLWPLDPPDPVGDLFALVAGQEQELPEALTGIDSDHVPEDRYAAYLDQRLGKGFGTFAQPGTPTSAEDRNR